MSEPMTTLSPARPGPSAVPVFGHLLVQYRRTWRGSVLGTFLIPILFLLGMGVSVGAYVDRIHRHFERLGVLHGIDEQALAKAAETS